MPLSGPPFLPGLCFLPGGISYQWCSLSQFFISYESCRTVDVLLTRQNVEKQENFFLHLYNFYFRRQVLESCYLIFI